MQFVNLTPHELNIHSGNTVLTIPPSGEVARVAQNFSYNFDKSIVCAIDVYTATYGSVEGLPEQKPNTAYIVSGLVKAAVNDRTDVYAPGELVRDENGKPIGCKGLRA